MFYVNKIRKNKKGSLVDIMFIAGILLAFGLIVLFGFKFMAEFNGQIQGMGIIPDTAKASTNQLENMYPGVIDNSFLLLTVGMAIGAFVLAALVRISPIFLALYILALILVIFMCGIFSNIYQEMAKNTQIIAQADQLLFISNVLTYLPIIVGVIGSLLAIVMYKSWRDSQGI